MTCSLTCLVCFDRDIDVCLPCHIKRGAFWNDNAPFLKAHGLEIFLSSLNTPLLKAHGLIALVNTLLWTHLLYKHMGKLKLSQEEGEEHRSFLDVPATPHVKRFKRLGRCPGFRQAGRGGHLGWHRRTPAKAYHDRFNLGWAPKTPRPPLS